MCRPLKKATEKIRLDIFSCYSKGKFICESCVNEDGQYSASKQETYNENDPKSFVLAQYDFTQYGIVSISCVIVMDI